MYICAAGNRIGSVRFGTCVRPGQGSCGRNQKTGIYLPTEADDSKKDWLWEAALVSQKNCSQARFPLKKPRFARK